MNDAFRNGELKTGDKGENDIDGFGGGDDDFAVAGWKHAVQAAGG